MADSSIDRDLYTMWSQIQVWWAHAYPIISSLEAIRLYTIVVLSALTIASGLIAYFAKKRLTKLERAAVNLAFPGPDPKTETSIEKRLAALIARAEKELKPFRRALWILLGCGLVLPTVCFVLVAMNYNWFDPIGLPFVSLGDRSPLQTVNDTTLAYFTVNQFSHGALFDVLEVFNIDMTTVGNNPHNYWFSGVVLLYRSLVSGFVVALAIGWGQFFYVRRSFRAKIAEKIEQFKKNAAVATAAASHITDRAA